MLCSGDKMKRASGSKSWGGTGEGEVLVAGVQTCMCYHSAAPTQWQHRGNRVGHASAFGSLCLLVFILGVEFIKCRRASSVAENKRGQAPSGAACLPACRGGAGLLWLHRAEKHQVVMVQPECQLPSPHRQRVRARCGLEPLHGSQQSTDSHTDTQDRLIHGHPSAHMHMIEKTGAMRTHGHIVKQGQPGDTGAMRIWSPQNTVTHPQIH